jgi:hypothetical protein
MHRVTAAHLAAFVGTPEVAQRRQRPAVLVRRRVFVAVVIEVCVGVCVFSAVEGYRSVYIRRYNGVSPLVGGPYRGVHRRICISLCRVL